MKLAQPSPLCWNFKSSVYCCFFSLKVANFSSTFISQTITLHFVICSCMDGADNFYLLWSYRLSKKTSVIICWSASLKYLKVYFWQRKGFLRPYCYLDLTLCLYYLDSSLTSSWKRIYCGSQLLKAWYRQMLASCFWNYFSASARSKSSCFICQTIYWQELA